MSRLAGVYKEIANREEADLKGLNVDKKLANEICVSVCAAFGLLSVPVLIFDKEKIIRRTIQRKGMKYLKTANLLGRCFGGNNYHKKIELYLNGHNVSTLLHEIAHLKEYHHQFSFYLFNVELMKHFKSELKEKYFPSIETIEKQEKPDMEKEMKRIVDELECESKNNTLKMKDIGFALLEEKLNTAENIQMVKRELIKRGFKVV